MKKTITVILSFLLALFNGVTIAAFSNSLLNNSATIYTCSWGWNKENFTGKKLFYTPLQKSKELAYNHSRDIAIQTQEEGTVLLKNQNSALPLSENEMRVSVFGTGSVNIAYGGTGSGNGSDLERVSLYSALDDNGFLVNPNLKSFYEKKYTEGYHRGLGTDMNGAFYGNKGRRNYGYSINEVEKEAYAEVFDSFSSYNDAALIVFSRSGGEGQDLPTSMKEFYEADDKNYLELTDEEISLLELVKEKDFKKTIVLLNTMNTFELGFLENEEYSIDAALWIGGPGQYGTLGVARILKGESSPQGRLADSYASDLFSAPSMMNYGDNHYLDSGNMTTSCYVAYSENIYVGYRYYETRYEDSLFGINNAGDFDYDSEIVYPFGYGLGYSQFIWSEPSFSIKDETVEVTLEVSNVGKRKGKDVVQLYCQKPYTDFDKENGIEKSAIDLLGFAKSGELAPNESEFITIKADKRMLASYDSKVNQTYLLEKNDNYYLSVGRNCHDALKNIVSAKKNDDAIGDSSQSYRFSVGDDCFYDTSDTGYKITINLKLKNIHLFLMI